jgi:hypothetical protein
VQAGVEYEGETAPHADRLSRRAIQIWNHLSNGQGAIDWSGLPVMVELFGVDDVDLLLHQLLVIKTHRPPDKE